jgi:hypothetical protein
MPTLPVPSSSYQLLLLLSLSSSTDAATNCRYSRAALTATNHVTMYRRATTIRTGATMYPVTSPSIPTVDARTRKVEGAGDRQHAAARVAVAPAERVQIQGPGRSHEAAEERDYPAHLGPEPQQVHWEREEHVQEEAHRVGRDGTLHVPKGLDAHDCGALGRGVVATHYDHGVHVQQQHDWVARVHEEEAQMPEGVASHEPEKELNPGRSHRTVHRDELCKVGRDRPNIDGGGPDGEDPR